MDLFSGYIWIFFSKLMQTLFWVSTRIYVRYFSHEVINSACSSNLCYENCHIEYNNSQTKTEAEANYSKVFIDTKLKSEIFEEGNDTIQLEQICSHQNDSNGSEPVANLGLEEEETTKLVFKFQYQTWKSNDEFKGSYSETFDLVVNTDNNISVASGSTNNKYEFISGQSLSHFLEEHDASCFILKEPCVHSKDVPDFQSEKNFEPESCERRCVDATEKIETVHYVEHEVENMNDKMFVVEVSAERNNFLSVDDFICLSSELDSNSFIGDEFLSDTDFGTTIELHTLENYDEENAVLEKEEMGFDEGKNSETFNDENRDIMPEIRKLEEENRMQNADLEDMEKLNGHCFQDRHVILLHSSAGSDHEDSHKFDAQWEHQDLIEQLKMELKKVRATGLPTIFENSDSPRIMENLKPWQIDENFQHGSTICELPKFYKSYMEQMRKFDILNYQKLYAIGSLKSKDMLQSFSSHENSSPAITSFLPHIFHHNRRKKSESESDPLKKFMREFYSDLEMVYVGQLCLSWEFLQWEYEKALELCETHQNKLQSYNEVAGEFQQFQVLLQRFLENEPFQGPRVEYYVRNRCVMRNLLQAPAIREDNTMEEKKFKTRDADKDEITNDMLVEILEESIRTIWHFIRADKDASSLNHKGPRETQLELQDPADSELLVRIQAELQKKEKKLNEFLKSRSSILKKFQKLEDDGRDNFLYILYQVDMKLVWRVLNMSKITRDQLAWCHYKLNNINFGNRRIHTEPSFFLFPC